MPTPEEERLYPNLYPPQKSYHQLGGDAGRIWTPADDRETIITPKAVARPVAWNRDVAVHEMVRELDERAANNPDWDRLSHQERFGLLSKAEYEAVIEQASLCADDFSYAARNYFWITDNDGRDSLMTLWESQYLILQKFYELKERGIPQKLYVLKARQLGASLLVEAMIAWRTMFFPNINALVCSVDAPHAAYVFGLALHIVDKMPWWLKPEIASREEQKGIWFDNPDAEKRSTNPGLNSHVYVQWSTQSSGVGQGRKILACHATELTDWYQGDAVNIIEADLKNAVKDSPEAFWFVETTGKESGSYSHRLWRGCERLAKDAEGQFVPVFLPWFFESTRKRKPPKDWQAKKPEIAMRERVKLEWVRCNSCLQYFSRSMHGRDRNGEPCPSCGTGKVAYVWLTDDQMYWKEVQRKQAEFNGREALIKATRELACVLPDTRVSTDEGVIRIVDARRSRRTETGSVLKWYEYENREICHVRTRFGREVGATVEQQFYHPDGTCTEALSLTEGMPLSLSGPKFASAPYTAKWKHSPTCEMSVEISPQWGKFLGYFMGDGCWKKNMVEIACDLKDLDVVEDVSATCEAIIGTPVSYYQHGGMKAVRSSSILWFPLLSNLGAVRYWHNNQWGYRRHVHVPECIWKSPKEVVREFLSAVFECDSHAYKNLVHTKLFTKYKSFAQEVQLLLLGFGINSRVRPHPAHRGGRTFEGYELILHSVATQKFHREIGYIGQRKRTTACVREYRGSVPDPYADQEVDYVKDVVCSGELATVYDLTIADVHRFGANGLLIHNTTAEESFMAGGISVFPMECQEAVAATIRDPETCPGVMVGYFDSKTPLNKDPFIPGFHGLDGTHPHEDYPGKFHCYKPECQYDHSGDSDMFNVTIWEKPVPGAYYSVGVDVAEGLGQNYSVIFVNKFGAAGRPDEQVAILRDNRIDTIPLAYFCVLMGHWYNDALMCIEYEGIGKSTADKVLHDYQYPNIFRWKHMDSRQIMSNKWHWYTKPDTRQKLWQTSRYWIRSGAWIIRSKNFLAEMQTFQKEEDEDAKRADHAAGATDDELMAGMIALYAGHEAEADERGIVRAPLVEQTPETHRYLMRCNACGFEWGADSPEFAYRCPRGECQSVLITGTRLEKEVTMDSEAYGNTLFAQLDQGRKPGSEEQLVSWDAL